MSSERTARFEALFQSSSDPWAYRSRWYEVRKRAITVAMLPCERFTRAFEAGCANGELTAALSERCETLLAMDASANAVELARQRLSSSSNVEILRGEIPAEWPDGQFDLVVLSEIGYFLTKDEVVSTAARCRAALQPAGVLLACHWRYPIEGYELDGEVAHALIERECGFTKLSRLVEDDFLLEVWSADARSVAQRGGLVPT